MPESVLPAPKRRYEVVIKIGADTFDDLKAAIHNVGHTVDRYAGPPIGCVSGGCSFGYIVELTEHPEMTHERYIEELNAYLEAQKDHEHEGAPE